MTIRAESRVQGDGASLQSRSVGLGARVLEFRALPPDHASPHTHGLAETTEPVPCEPL